MRTCTGEIEFQSYNNITYWVYFRSMCPLAITPSLDPWRNHAYVEMKPNKVIVLSDWASRYNFFPCLCFQVAMVWGFVGAIGTTILIYILPPAFYLRVRLHPPRPDLKQIAAWGLMLTGFAVLVVCTYQSFANVIDPIPKLVRPHDLSNQTTSGWTSACFCRKRHQKYPCFSIARQPENVTWRTTTTSDWETSSTAPC